MSAKGLRPEELEDIRDRMSRGPVTNIDVAFLLGHIAFIDADRVARAEQIETLRNKLETLSRRNQKLTEALEMVPWCAEHGKIVVVPPYRYLGGCVHCTAVLTAIEVLDRIRLASRAEE